MIRKVTLLCYSLLIVVSNADQALSRPRVLVTSESRDDVRQKISNQKWALDTYNRLKKRVDKYVIKTAAEPEWLSSRLAMNWDTHYVQAITKESQTIGGEGRAPIPTPRFAGARDWKSSYSRQSIDNLHPYNDKDGQIFLMNNETGKEEWVSPAVTGHCVEGINKDIMKLVAEAAFVYWVSGEQQYAELAAPVLWKFMYGLSYVKKPIILDKKGPHKIIGTFTYEVIHEKAINDIAVAYDFLHDYIDAHPEMRTDVIEQGIKKVIDRVVEGGGRTGNWNLHQAREIAYGGLALRGNNAYEDGKGRGYYIDIVLNGDLPNQWGIIPVMNEGYDQETAIWPEAAGYAFDTTANIVQIASMLTDAGGEKAIGHRTLSRAVINQLNQLYPNGDSTGIGDTRYTRFDTRAAELMLKYTMENNKTDYAKVLSHELLREVESGKYIRGREDSLIALTQYLPKLPEFREEGHYLSPSYYAKPLDIVMLRNMPSDGDLDYAIAAALFGTNGGHMHSNGLALELYGAGHILGIDSGRGSSYWQPDHNEYYKQPPAHNTVIVNGVSNYTNHGEGQIQMKVNRVEPPFGHQIGEDGLCYVTSTLEYKKPKAIQQRTLALVRVDEETAFFFDVFRSKLRDSQEGEYHDWFYHGMADDVSIKGLEFQPSSLLTSKEGNMKGYDYFTNEVSVQTDQLIQAQFPLEVREKRIAMNVLVCSGKERQVFSVQAPANRAARNFPKSFWDRKVPALVLRHYGEAWNQPFVAVYEPYKQKEGPKVQGVKKVSENTWEVLGEGWSRTFTLDQTTLKIRNEKD